MMPRHRAAAGLLPAALLTSVAFAESALEHNWDLAALLAAAVVLQVAGLGFGWRGRQPVGLRPDLAVWLHQHATATGEPVERIVDRAVAEHRAARTGGPS